MIIHVAFTLSYFIDSFPYSSYKNLIPSRLWCVQCFIKAILHDQVTHGHIKLSQICVIFHQIPYYVIFYVFKSEVHTGGFVKQMGVGG